MIKKIRIELIIVCLLVLNIFISAKIGVGIDSVFQEIISPLNNTNLKYFFIDITRLGDSSWVFFLSLFILIFFYALKKFFSKKTFSTFNKLKIFAFFLLSGTLITGLITQIIKHVIGRPRPNHVDLDLSLGLDFFTLDSAFHSFPSGHTSTIFIVALIVSAFVPKIKYFVFFFAAIIGLSRVFVGAHFFTDIMGGIIVANIGFKLSLLIFNKIKILNKLLPTKLNASYFSLSLIVMFISIIFLTLGSDLDIYLSSLFYEGNNSFKLQKTDVLTFFSRKIFLYSIIFYLLLLPFLSAYLPIKKLYFDYSFKKKEVFYIFSITLFNLIFVVNVLLKNMWGRARPNDIIELGGINIFTPWYKISQECSNNCSFVSGDASVGFAIITLFFITKNIRFLWVALICGFYLGFVRIAEGGHFFSDVFFAGFVVFVLSFLSSLIYKKNINYDK